MILNIVDLVSLIVVYRIDWRDTLSRIATPLFKYSFPAGWRQESLVSSQQSYHLERCHWERCGRIRIQGEGQRDGLQTWLARCVSTTQSGRVSNRKISHKIR